MKAIILASLLGGAAGAVVVNGTINYSSPFKLTVPIDSAFHVVPSVANIWSWTGPADGSPILVDIDGDGVMDTNDPKVKVVITDMQVRDLRITGNSETGVELMDASGPRWFQRSWNFNSLLQSDSTHFSTPIVLPTGSDLWLQTFDGGQATNASWTPTVTLIGRVQNL